MAKQESTEAYRLRRYVWRTTLSICGPLSVFAFYALICFVYLRHPPQHDVVGSHWLDARWVFYVWLILSIFILDWAKSGLANFEATALMKPSLAPRDVVQLLWHQDSNWNNPLWWLRAIRNVACRMLRHKIGHAYSHYAANQPSPLWWLLTTVTLLIFTAIPLSGLSMELTSALEPSKSQAGILGPKPETFNLREWIGLPQMVRGSWRSGRSTSPTNDILYAPHNTPRVSATYYDDIIRSPTNETIQFFTGPEVFSRAHGRIWGLETNITCRSVNKKDLVLFGVDDVYTYNLTFAFANGTTVSRRLSDNSTSQLSLQNDTIMPRLLNETGTFESKMVYAWISAADGPLFGSQGQYQNGSNAVHTSFAPSWVPADQRPGGYFETYLWQAMMPKYQQAPHFQELLRSQSPLLSFVNRTQGKDNLYFVGCGVSCTVTSAVGNATLDAALRTYSNFTQHAPPGQLDRTDPPQLQALKALGKYEMSSGITKPFDPSSTDSTWLAADLSINEIPYPTEPVPKGNEALMFAALTPANLQLSVQKLLGEATIAMMGRGGQSNWNTSSLLILRPTTYLVQGVIPWQLCLALLGIWTILSVAMSTWILFHKRWAPNLSGWEFFKFGAEYQAVLSKTLTDTKFEMAGDGLRTIPGMVGNLGAHGIAMRDSRVAPEDDIADSTNDVALTSAIHHGHDRSRERPHPHRLHTSSHSSASSSSSNEEGDEYRHMTRPSVISPPIASTKGYQFVGLSDRPVDPDGVFVLDRTQAGTRVSTI